MPFQPAESNIPQVSMAQWLMMRLGGSPANLETKTKISIMLNDATDAYDDQEIQSITIGFLSKTEE